MAKSIICDLLQIFKSSVSAVIPENLIRKSINYNPTSQHLTVLEEKFNLQNKSVYLIGTGKAVQNMAKEIENMLGSKIKCGIISIPVGSLNQSATNKNVLYCEGAQNNLPDSDAENTAKKIKALITKLEVNDLLLVLISGGGSALLPLPKGAIILEEKTELIRKLANSGADIKELNTVRKCLSDIKGGQLAIKAQPAKVISLIMSDIVGDPLDLIASGPTTENTDEPTKAIAIIKKYKLFNELPSSMLTVLQENYIEPQFPKNNVSNYIVGSNKISIAAALEKASSMNYFTIALSNIVTGNIKTVAVQYAKLTKAFCEYLSGNDSLNNLKQQVDYLSIPGVCSTNLGDNFINKNVCLILGGEITVEVKGMGKGGRNQQLALEYSTFIHKLKNKMNDYDIYFLSAGTDGIDGPTDAAGGIGYLNLISDSKKDNINVEQYLLNNDSYNFYRKFKNGALHVITGHTNTNVMDIHLILIKRKNLSGTCRL